MGQASGPSPRSQRQGRCCSNQTRGAGFPEGGAGFPEGGAGFPEGGRASSPRLSITGGIPEGAGLPARVAPGQDPKTDLPERQPPRAATAPPHTTADTGSTPPASTRTAGLRREAGVHVVAPIKGCAALPSPSDRTPRACSRSPTRAMGERAPRGSYPVARPAETTHSSKDASSSSSSSASQSSSSSSSSASSSSSSASSLSSSASSSRSSATSAISSA